MGNEFHFDPLASIQMETYFLALCQQAGRSGEDLQVFLRGRVSEDFRYVTEPPNWIHGSDWQLFEGKPMLFIGEVRVPLEAKLYRNESAFYVFLDKESGVVRTVRQV